MSDSALSTQGPPNVPNPTEALVVEDSATQALKIRYLLERNGCHVTWARGGLEALDRLRELPVHIVLSDVAMPQMDGYELCRQIRADPRLHHLPIILLTALSDPREVVRGLKCGANHFVVKPYDENLLLSQVRYLLENQALRQNSTAESGLQVAFAGELHTFTADRFQMVDLLLSSYHTALQKNRELQEATEALEQRSDELERSNAELQQFGYVVSHDLQEPLRAISGFLDLLRRRYAGKLDDNAEKYIESAIGGAQRMQALIRDLLGYARIGNATKPFKTVDGNKILEHALQNLVIAIQESGATVTQPDTLPQLVGDETLLTQLFQNLIANALKFKREDVPPVIDVSAEKRGNYWEFRVRDNGIGIEEKYFSRIFQVFQRLHERERYQGTGIGLALCKKIVERHGGRIWVESEPGCGATFHFTLKAT